MDPSRTTVYMYFCSLDFTLYIFFASLSVDFAERRISLSHVY